MQKISKIFQGISLFSLFAVLLGGMMFLSACNKSGEQGGHSHEGGEEHGHAGEKSPTLSFTLWSEKVELFVEFPPLLEGKGSKMAAHFTRLADYSPVEAGKLTVILTGPGAEQRAVAESPVRPGIFGPEIVPLQTGLHRLIFKLEGPGLKEEFVLDSMKVFPSLQAAKMGLKSELAADPEEIKFTKDQAWKTVFSVAVVKADSLGLTLHTGGEILPVRGGEEVLAATSHGRVRYRRQNLQPGSEVSGGEQLFTLQSQGMSHENLATEIEKAKATFEQAKTTFGRKQQLMEIQAITRTEYEEARLSLSLAETELRNLSEGYSADGKAIAASINGFVKELLVQPGQFVVTGEALAVITRNQRLTLRADLPQGFYNQLSRIRSMAFRPTGSPRLYSMEEFGGKLISYGREVSHGEPYVPVFFEVDNKEGLLPGSFAEFFLETRPLKATWVIPREALLEDFGTYSVMVQTSGEGFKKREIRIGTDNGKAVEVLSGLSPGERVVAKGAYQVKMASLSNSLPAHHSH